MTLDDLIDFITFFAYNFDRSYRDLRMMVLTYRKDYKNLEWL